MKKILIIMIPLICSYAQLNAHRNQNMSQVTIKNLTGQNLIVAGATIPRTKIINLQRGTPYDITVKAKDGTILGTLPGHYFTQGTYEVNAEPDTQSSNPNALTITVTKPGPKKTYSPYY